MLIIRLKPKENITAVHRNGFKSYYKLRNILFNDTVKKLNLE